MEKTTADPWQDEKVRGLVDALADSPCERTAWLVLADRFSEIECPELEYACRWAPAWGYIPTPPERDWLHGFRPQPEMNWLWARGEHKEDGRHGPRASSKDRLPCELPSVLHDYALDRAVGNATWAAIGVYDPGEVWGREERPRNWGNIWYNTLPEAIRVLAYALASLRTLTELPS